MGVLIPVGGVSFFTTSWGMINQQTAFIRDCSRKAQVTSRGHRSVEQFGQRLMWKGLYKDFIIKGVVKDVCKDVC